MEDQDQDGQQQNGPLNIQQQQLASSFLEQRKWGRRRMRRQKMPNCILQNGVGRYCCSFCWTITLMTILLTITGCHSLSYTASNHQPESSHPMDSEEHQQQRDSAKNIHQQLFLWQKQQNQRRRQKSGGGQPNEEAGAAQKGRKPADGTSLLPYSQYERMLLAKALAEHNSVEERADKGGEEIVEEPTRSDQPVIIHLPPYSKTSRKSVESFGKGSQRDGGDQLLFQTHNGSRERGNRKTWKNGTKSTKSAPNGMRSMTTSAESSSFLQDGETMEKERKMPMASMPMPKSHNPIRAQTAAAGANGKWHQRKRPTGIGIGMGNGIDGRSQQQGDLEWNGGDGRTMGHELQPPTIMGKSSYLNFRKSSAENSLITRPKSMFLPTVSSSRKHGGAGARVMPPQIRPIEPVNGAGQRMFLKRIQSIGAGGIDQQGQYVDPEGMEIAKRLAPPSSPASAQGVSTLLSQLFSNSASSAAGQPPPQAPLSGSPFDLLGGGGGGIGTSGGAQSLASNPLLSQLPNPLQLLTQGTTLEQITTLARNLIQMSNGNGGGNPELLSSLTKMISGSPAGSADGPASKLTSTAVTTALQKLAAANTTHQQTIESGNGTAKTNGTEKPKEAEQIRTLFSSNGLGNSKANGQEGGGEAEGNKQEKNCTELAELNEVEKDSNKTDSLAILNGLPVEQRNLLEAALKNGELDLEQAEKFIASEGEQQQQQKGSPLGMPKDSSASVPSSQSPQRRLVNAESRLMEWIQQNRPRPERPQMQVSEEIGSNISKEEGGNKETKGGGGGGTSPIEAMTTNAANGQQWNNANAKDEWQWANRKAEKLPYYGRYCGSFVEQQQLSSNSTASARFHGISGALWAVDERRLVVTKFRFIPLDHSENITFWAGPANLSGTSADFFPSDNGFHLTPLPVDAQTFMLKPIQKVEARISEERLPMPLMPSPSKDDYSNSNETSSSMGIIPAEREFLEADENEMKMMMASSSSSASALPENGGNELGKRAKRNLYNELYGPQQQPFMEPTQMPMPLPMPTTIVPIGSPPNKLTVNQMPATVVPMHFDGNARSFHLSLGNGGRGDSKMNPSSSTTSSYTSAAKGIEKLSAHQIVIEEEAAAAASTDFPHRQPNFLGASAASNIVNGRWQSLGWSDGHQPLLLTLPEGRLVKTLNWLAIWEHNNNNNKDKAAHALGMVLMPTGVSFQVPSTVQLRPLPAPAIGVAGIQKLRSGPIRVLDRKTIEVTDFSFRAENGLPAWFMAGKEIMPNARGHILPIYDKKSNTFDCNSLREFHNETVTLRVPDPWDLKDVFWFAVFSIPRGIPLSHIYIPYNDMQLPPDLLGISTPQCIWNGPFG